MPNRPSKQETDQCLVAVEAQIEAGTATCQTVQALINDCQTIKNGRLDDDAYDDFMALFENIRDLATIPPEDYLRFKKWEGVMGLRHRSSTRPNKVCFSRAVTG
jgi:hypothetical protein